MSAPPRWLFWHRRDLRLADNRGLVAALAATPAVTGVVLLDPREWQAPDQAPARLWFWRESLIELQERWRQAGSRLLLLQGDAETWLPPLARAVGAEAVAWNRGVEPEERARDRRLAAALKAQGQKVVVGWDQLLVAPEGLRTGAGDPYRVYGPFLRNWRGQVERQQGPGEGELGELIPLPAPSGLLDLDPACLQGPDPGLPLLASIPAAVELAPALGGGFAR